MDVKKKGATKRRTAVPPGGMTPPQRAFCAAYLSNGFVASQAYRANHPQAKSTTCEQEGSRYLRLPKVAAYLREQMESVWAAQQMSGEEALALMAMNARLDVRRMFGASGLPLHPREWPHDLAMCTRGVELTEHGWRVTFESPQAARKIILEQTGKLRNTVADGFDALAAAIREDIEAHT